MGSQVTWSESNVLARRKFSNLRLIQSLPDMQRTSWQSRKTKTKLYWTYWSSFEKNNSANRILWWIGSVAKLRVQKIHKLDKARTKTDAQMLPVLQHSCDSAMGRRGFWRFLGQSSRCKISRNSLPRHGKEVAVPSYFVLLNRYWWIVTDPSHCGGHACAGVCEFLALIVTCTLNLRR